MPTSTAAEPAPPAGSGSASNSSAGGAWPLSGAGWHSFAVANAGAALKSVEIVARGSRLLGAAAYAFVATGIDEAFGHQRARLSCRSTSALLDLERDYLVRAIARNTWRTGLVAGMLGAVGDDAVYPVRRRLDCALQVLGETHEA